MSIEITALAPTMSSDTEINGFDRNGIALVFRRRVASS
jgi:hypothetical protein